MNPASLRENRYKSLHNAIISITVHPCPFINQPSSVSHKLVFSGIAFFLVSMIKLPINNTATNAQCVSNTVILLPPPAKSTSSPISSHITLRCQISLLQNVRHFRPSSYNPSLEWISFYLSKLWHSLLQL